MQKNARNTRKISEKVYTNINTSPELQIKIQQLVITENISDIQSSHLNLKKKNQLSIYDKTNLLSERIRISQKNERLSQENLFLREKLYQIQNELQDANLKCSLWDKFRITIEGLNADYLNLKSIENNCSDSTILKQFLTHFKDNLQKLSISEKMFKTQSVQVKRKDTEYYQLYEQQKKQRYEYQQHIITLFDDLKILQKQTKNSKKSQEIHL